MKEGDIIIGRYKIQNKLGQGGMGQVYRGHDLELDKAVAIKVLFPNTPDIVIKRFHTEAKALAKFNHPNIMSVLHFGQAENGQLYLVMDFVKGDSLSSLIEKRGPQTFFDVLPMFEKICRGLKYAHMEGVMHRDIKPSNVMLGVDRYKDDGVKLVDFGLAKPSDEDHSLTKTGTTMGSPPYMSPEAVHGKETDERSDIYSLGCTLFEMMAAVPPFVGETPFHTMMAQINRLPPTLEEACEKPFDEEVETYVQKFLKKNPNDRYQNMDEVIEELERVKNALTEKKRASEGMLASSIYASSAWLVNKTAKLNAVLKGGLRLLLVVFLLTASAVWLVSAFKSAPSVKPDEKGVASAIAGSEKLDQAADDAFDLATHGRSIRKAKADEKSKETEYDPEDDIIGDKDFPGQSVCLFTGDLTDEDVKLRLATHKGMKGFQFQDVRMPVKMMHLALNFPIQRLHFVNTSVTEDTLERVGRMRELQYLRIFDCGDLPEGSLDKLKPLKENKLFMNLCITTGRAYNQPAVPFAGMPMLVNVKFDQSTITRADTKALASLKNLQTLQFKKCKIAPDAISELKAASKGLYSLEINGTSDLTAQHFKQIAELHSLTKLRLNNTNLDNTNLLQLKSLKKLLFVDAQDTKVDEAGARELKKAIPELAHALKFGVKVRDE